MTQPTILDSLTCELCDYTGADVQPSLVLDRLGKYRHLARCKDTGRCRARVESQGKRWPLAERIR